MKITCGTDIIEVERIKDAIEKNKEQFLDRVFTKNEIEYCQNKGVMSYQHFAARFAAKEAIFKAISEVLDNKYDLEWNDFEIINDENGKPHAKILNNKNNNIEQIDISLSHIKEYAIANCVVVIND